MDNTFTGRSPSLGHRSLGYGTSFALSFGIGSFAALAGAAPSAGDMAPAWVPRSASPPPQFAYKTTVLYKTYVI